MIRMAAGCCRKTALLAALALILLAAMVAIPTAVLLLLTALCVLILRFLRDLACGLYDYATSKPRAPRRQAQPTVQRTEHTELS